jgi:hypothetical protein
LNFAESAIRFDVYRTTSIAGLSSPFFLLPADGAGWRNYTEAVIAKRGGGSYYVLVGHAAPGQEAAAETLLDQRCLSPQYGAGGTS